MLEPIADPIPAVLDELAERLRQTTLEALRGADRDGDPGDLCRPVALGIGDVTFGLDERTEAEVERWFGEQARRGPLSVLTEDKGWGHRGPDGSGGWKPLEDFDHGGPRIAIDPVDGTRNLMFGLRPAWTVLAAAPPGTSEPRLGDLSYGCVAELPLVHQDRVRIYRAHRDGIASRTTLDLRGLEAPVEVPLGPTADTRADHGYFPFFRYRADQRPKLAEVEAAFFRRIAAEEGAQTDHCYDDQYIASAAHMVLLAEGTYRMVSDLRGHLARVEGQPTLTAKPYDIAGALPIALACGCRFEDASGGPLDLPLDATTPVSWVGYTNAGTQARLSPHLDAAMAEVGVPRG